MARVLRCPAGPPHTDAPARGWRTLARWHSSEVGTGARAAHRGYPLLRTAHSLEPVEILHTAPQLASCCASARSSTPCPTPRTRTELGINERALGHPSSTFTSLPRSACALLSILKEHCVESQDGFLKFLAALPTGSNSISEFTSKNLAFPSTPVATTCLSPTVLDRHSRTLNHADLGCMCCAVFAGHPATSTTDESEYD